MKNNEIKIKLVTVDNVKKFIEIVTEFNEPIDIVSGRYIVDAKSIIGIFSIDLSREVNCVIHSDDEKVVQKFIEKVENLNIIVK